MKNELYSFLATPAGVAVSRDGSVLFVANGGSNTITAYSTATGLQILDNFPITEAISFPTGMAILPPSPQSPVAPPANLSGRQKKNDFGIEYERFNRLKWTASPSPDVAGYFVYRSGLKIATPNASTLTDEDHNRQKGIATQYSITAFNEAGIESSPIYITIH